MKQLSFKYCVFLFCVALLQNKLAAQTATDLYRGAIDDGYSMLGVNNITCNPSALDGTAYCGAADDGYSMLGVNNLTCNPSALDGTAYRGAADDGYSMLGVNNITCTPSPSDGTAYRGAADDGYSMLGVNNITCTPSPSDGTAYRGAADDGYSALKSACTLVISVYGVTITSLTNICGSTCSGTATASAGNGTPPYNYVWSPSGGNNAVAVGLCAGTYTVTATDGTSATVTTTVTIMQSAALTITDSSLPDTCGHSNGAATISLNGGTSPFTYSWDAAAGGQTSPTAVGLAAGNYTATVTDSLGCLQTHTVSVANTSGFTVTVTATLNTIVAGDSTQLTASGGDTYLWSPSAGLSDSAIANPWASPAQTTAYCVTVTNTTTGCIDSSCMTLTVTTIQTTCEPYIPNAFSPNADGENNFLRVQGDCIKELSLTIYNRWGEKVFTSTDISMLNDATKGWDGIYKGKPLNTGVFVYYLTATLNDGTPLELTGNISLIR